MISGATAVRWDPVPDALYQVESWPRGPLPTEAANALGGPTRVRGLGFDAFVAT
jgi:hypothetical protein